MLRLWTLGVLSAVLLSGLALAPQASPAPLAITGCSTSQLSDIMAAYTSTPAPHEHTVLLPGQTRGYLAYVLEMRLKECSARLGGFTPGAKGPPTPGSACYPTGNERNVRILWRQLQLCAALVDPPVPASATIKWQLPPTSSTGNRPVIFVVGAGGDPAMIGKLISSLTIFLDQTGYYLTDDAVLIPEPTWSPDLFAAQCVASPHVEGAIVVQITAAGSGASDLFVSRKNWTAIEATALYAKCERGRPDAPGIPTYVWISNMAKAENHYITVTPLTPLAMLLTIGAAYEEFAPARTHSQTSTHVIPAPSPEPSGGYISQIQTTNATTLNASALGGVAAGFLSSAISYTNTTAPLTSSPTVDQQTWDTLQGVAYELVKEMNCWQPPPSAIASLAVSDVAGHPRKVPSYNPPPGLGRYSSGEPSAPFCAEPQSPTGGGESIHDILPPVAPPQW